ncbi:MAG: hypothetical protein AAF449_21530, partial [Myxococcota bacterium]
MIKLNRGLRVPLLVGALIGVVRPSVCEAQSVGDAANVEVSSSVDEGSPIQYELFYTGSARWQLNNGNRTT